MRGIYTTLIILVSAGVAYAAPAVTGVSGTVATGQTLSISGSAFGTHALQVESLQSVIEAGTVEQTFTRSGWTQSDWTWASPKYATDASHSGDKSLKCVLTSNNDYNCAFAYIYPNPIQAGHKAYFSWWVKYNGDTNGQWKMFKLKQMETIVDGPMDWVYFNWFSSQQTASYTNSQNAECGIWPNENTAPKGDNKWYRFELEVFSGSLNTSNGGFTVRTTTDTGAIYQETKTGCNTHVSSNDEFRYAIWQNYIGNGIDNATIHIDDIYVQTGTLARVELCSGSTWSNRGKCEVQVPTAWNGTAITATANTGNFTNASNVYLYVVDNDGGVSPAYGPLTIGSSGGGDPPDPDTTSPSVTITTQAQTITGSTLTVTGTASDNDAVSSCRWQLGSVPTSSTGTACTGTTSFSCATTGHVVGANTVYVACFDPTGNRGSDSVVITRSAADTTPPVLSGGQPSGTLPAGTTSTTVSLTTDEDATCRWMPISGVAYASMTNTFGSTGTTSHSETASGLTNGSTYNRYIRCIDGSGNANTTDYHISWSVASPPVDSISIGTTPIPYVGN